MLIDHALTTIVKESDKENEAGDTELLLLMLICKRKKKETTGSCLSGRSRMQRRTNTRLSIYMPTKISTLLSKTRTEHIDKHKNEENCFFLLHLISYQYKPSSV